MVSPTVAFAEGVTAKPDELLVQCLNIGGSAPAD